MSAPWQQAGERCSPLVIGMCIADRPLHKGKAMGLLDLLLGRVRPAAGTVAQPPEAVRAALLALDRASAPYTVRQATAAERCDLVAEWRIVDARWYEIFAKAALKSSFTVFIRLDAAARTVRALERRTSLEWRAGWPKTFVEGEVSWGRTIEKSFGAAVGCTEQLRPGVVYAYRFDSGEIIGPLRKTVTSMGWTWRAVAPGRL